MTPPPDGRDSSSPPAARTDEIAADPHASDARTDRREHRSKTAILLGNLDVGKTTLFNAICGRKAKTTNVRGTSVSIGRGVFFESGTEFHLIDTPGFGGMMPESEDRKVSRSILLDEKPDIMAQVADGKNLRKSLLLTVQLAEYEMPFVLDINMMDEVGQRGIRIDARKLSSLLGVPVTETVALEGKGVASFRRAFAAAAVANLSVSYPPRVESTIATIAELLTDSDLPPRAASVALLVGDMDVKRRVAVQCGDDVLEKIKTMASDAQSHFHRPLLALILEARLQVVDEVLSEVQSVSPPARLPFSAKIGEWSRRPLTGIPIAVMVVSLMYLFVGQLGAQTLVGLFEGVVFGEWIVPLTERLLAWIPYPFIVDAFVGEFGLVSVGLTLAFGVVVPVLATFFFAFGILEDSGYLPRLSVLLDRVLRKIGLNGKGILPLILGFSCITMAILATRMLDTKRERLIATVLLMLGMPCAPLLAVMLVLLAGMSIWATVTVFGVIFIQIVIIGFVLGKILPGARSEFIQELPPVRIPRLWELVKKTSWRVWWFIKEAVPLFLLATFVLFVLDRIGTLTFLERVGKPVITGFLGLPAEGTEVVIMTMIRRESGAALLKEFSDTGLFDSVQVVVCLLVVTFLSPCVNAILVMLKERGIKGTLSIMVFITSYALVVGAVVNVVCRTFDVSFE